MACPEYQPPATRVTVDDRVITASYRGSDVVIVDGSRMLTAYAGNPVTLGSQVVSVNAGAPELVVGTSTIAFPNDISDDPASAAATAAQKADESAFTAIMQGDAIVIHGADTTMTLQPGATATIGKEVLSIPSSGGMLVHDGTTVELEEPNTAGQSDATKSPQDGQALTVSAVGDSIVVHQSASGITLAAGAQGTVNGETVSITKSSGIAVVNESETLSLSQPASSTTTMVSDEPGAAESSTKSTVGTGDAPFTDHTIATASAFETGVESGSSSSRHVVSLDSLVFLVCSIVYIELL